MRVLAIDPGPHTGLAFWSGGMPGVPIAANCEEFRAWQVEGNDATWWEYEKYLVEPRDDYRPDVVVCEDFHIGGSRASEANVTIELIGIARYLCAEYGRSFVLQSPADARGFSSTEKLKRMGWWVPGQEHAQSASRHMLRYVAEAGLVDFRRMMSS